MVNVIKKDTLGVLDDENDCTGDTNHPNDCTGEIDHPNDCTGDINGIIYTSKKPKDYSTLKINDTGVIDSSLNGVEAALNA